MALDEIVDRGMQLKRGLWFRGVAGAMSEAETASTRPDRKGLRPYGRDQAPPNDPAVTTAIDTGLGRSQLMVYSLRSQA